MVDNIKVAAKEFDLDDLFGDVDTGKAAEDFQKGLSGIFGSKHLEDFANGDGTYTITRKDGTKVTFDLTQKEIVKKVIVEKTVEDYTNDDGTITLPKKDGTFVEVTESKALAVVGEAFDNHFSEEYLGHGFLRVKFGSEERICLDPEHLDKMLPPALYKVLSNEFYKALPSKGTCVNTYLPSRPHSFNEEDGSLDYMDEEGNKPEATPEQTWPEWAWDNKFYIAAGTLATGGLLYFTSTIYYTLVSILTPAAQLFPYVFNEGDDVPTASDLENYSLVSLGGKYTMSVGEFLDVVGKKGIELYDNGVSVQDAAHSIAGLVGLEGDA